MHLFLPWRSFAWCLLEFLFTLILLLSGVSVNVTSWQRPSPPPSLVHPSDFILWVALTMIRCFLMCLLVYYLFLIHRRWTPSHLSCSLLCLEPLKHCPAYSRCSVNLNKSMNKPWHIVGTSPSYHQKSFLFYHVQLRCWFYLLFGLNERKKKDCDYLHIFLKEQVCTDGQFYLLMKSLGSSERTDSIPARNNARGHFSQGHP